MPDSVQQGVTVHDVLDGAEKLISATATEFHKDAAISIQFMAGEWQKFKALIAQARAVHGPTPAPQPPAVPPIV